MRQRHIIPLIGTGIFIIAVIVFLTGWAILQGKNDAHRAAEIATANISVTLADSIAGAIHQADLGIQDILDEVARQQKKPRWDEAEIDATIARHEARLPEILGFRIFGPDGKLRYGIRNIASRAADLSQRDDFVFLRDYPGSGLEVTPPVLGQTGRQWMIGLARRITNPDGSFGGAVYGPIPVAALTKLFATVDLGLNGAIALVHTNFQIAARFPEDLSTPDPVGSPIASDRFRTAVASGMAADSFDYVSRVDGARRTATVRKVVGQPYYILVGLAESDYLADWRRNSVRFLAFGLLMVGVVLAGMSLLHRRIGDWERATAALAESEIKLRGLFDLSPIGIARNAVDGRFLEFNTAFRDITGYDEDELKALDYWGLTPPKYQDDEQRQLESLRTTGRYGPYEKDYIRKDGSLVPLQLRGVLVTGHDGLPFIWSLVEDITQRRQRTNELMFYRNLIEYTADCVYVVSPKQGFKLVFVNEATCRHFGLPRERLLEWRVPDWDPHFPDAASLEPVFEGIKRDRNVVFETTHRIASGEMIPVEVSANYLVLDGQEYLAGYFHDIAERTAAETAMRENTKLLTQSNEDLEQFAYVASHDLQTPLRNMVSYAQLLKRRYQGQLDADADEFIAFITDNGRRMTRLIADLLEYSRVTGNTKPLSMIAADQAAAEALGNLQSIIVETGAVIAVGPLPRVKAEHSLLVSLFQNLVGNGLKYRAPSRSPRISVTAERIDAEHWRFAVADNGIGIEPAYFERIFGIFQRLDPSSDTQGTGIGLSLCRRIVHRFGGTIWVDSDHGSGTTVFFTLTDRDARSPADHA